MSSTICLITGCEFLDVERKQHIRGDLHMIGTCLVMNTNGCKWVMGPMQEDERGVTSPIFYECGYAIVFPLETAMFNEVANAYLNNDPAMEGSRIITPPGFMQ